MTRVAIAGACGKMGRAVSGAIRQEPGLELVGAVDVAHCGEDLGRVAGSGPIGLIISDRLEETLRQTGAEILIDFTHPAAVAGNLRTALNLGVRAVVGTTGLTAAEREEMHRLALQRGTGAIIAPNFAIGAVLLQRFAAAAARFFPDVEIIERHHAEKADAPSGTAAQLAGAIARARPEADAGALPGAEGGFRGGAAEGIRIHSLRLPGSVAHHTVIFGGLGQTLTLSHDSLSRESFLPGIILAVKAVPAVRGVVYGIDALLAGQER